MQFLNIIFALLLFSLVYNYAVPRFTRGETRFYEIGMFAKAACTLMLTLIALAALAPLLFLLSLVTWPFFTMAGWSILDVPYSASQFAVELVLYFSAAQVAHWLAIQIVGEVFPGMLRIGNPKASFQAAILPTVYGGFAYGLLFASFC